MYLEYAPIAGISSSMRWDLPSYIRVPNLKFLASPVPKIRRMCYAMAGCAQTNAWISVVFYPTTSKFGIIRPTVNWSVHNAHVLDFLYVFVL